MKTETRFSEMRKLTSNPAEMLNSYLAANVLRSWTEDFVDEYTKEVVSIERNEVLFLRGTLIDQDILAQIKFYMNAGDIADVEISNQKRTGKHFMNACLTPYIAQAEIANKKVRFLLYANSVEMACSLLDDYIELNYTGEYSIDMIREFGSCVILIDNLPKIKSNTDLEKLGTTDVIEIDEQEAGEKRFYQIECNIVYINGSILDPTFIVQSFSVDRCIMLINKHIKENEAMMPEFTTMVKSAKPIAIGCFIPEAFSKAYQEQNDQG